MDFGKILVVHNRHAVSGGEDTVVDQEVSLLREHGHTVELVEASNEEIPFVTFTDKLAVGLSTLWSRSGYSLVDKAIRRFQPDIAHVHNTFNRLSPSVFWAFSHHNVPVATTLHNYLPLCANAGFVRNGNICLDCLGRLPLPGIRHRCYNNSLPASAAVVGMQITHRHILQTYPDKVHAFIIPSRRGMEFYRKAGWPDNRLFYKPHFVNNSIEPATMSAPERDRTILFVGRLSSEKGIRELLSAWSRIQTNWTLTIVGTGPLEHELTNTFASLKNVVWRGWCTRATVLDMMKKARFVVVPSLWHEPFGMVAVEALACGTPVLASNRGGLSDIVSSGENGLLFEPSLNAIEQALNEACSQTPSLWSAWAKQAYETYQRSYQPEDNYLRLIEIYRAAQGMASQ
jgi:glycosyltransferase involved in cell wall biosynthesis